MSMHEIVDYRRYLDIVEELEEFGTELEGLPNEAAEAIKDLVTAHQYAMIVIDDKLGETRLMKAGPKDDGYELELRSGPIPILAQYVVEMMGMDTDEPLNYIQFELSSPKYGSVVLTANRKDGRTAEDLHQETKAELKEALDKVRWYEWWLHSTEGMSSFDDAHSHYAGGDFSVTPPEH